MALLSVVIPSFNEEAMLPAAVKSISGQLKEAGIPYELIFVDDGSTDGTWQCITHASVSESGGTVRGIRFSRNFGKEAAIFAGLASAKGDCTAVMDCDLQHPPETLIRMYRLWEEGYEVVEGVKRSRGKESAAHSFAARTFYRIMSSSTGIDMSKASDFKLLDRKAVEVLLRIPERNAFFRAISSWIGFRTVSVEFDVQQRAAGESKWTVFSLTRYAVNNIVGFSSAPMKVVMWIGMLTLVFAFFLGIETLVRYFNGSAVEGFTTVILLLLLIGSLILISLGIIGYYISRIFEEVKGRPRYIISETV